MKRLMTAFAAGTLLLGVAAKAQYPPRYEDRSYNYNGEREERRARMFNQVQSDLGAAESSALPFTGDRQRIERARTEVSELQNAMLNGNYSRQQIDDAINALQRVMDTNRVMSTTDRDAISNDLYRLRELRERY